MKLLSGILLVSIQLIFLNPACALDIKDRDEFLKDVRSDDGNIYLNRISLYKKIDSLDIGVFCFGEAQRNLKTNVWEKMTAGLEAEKCFFKCLYVGGSIQHISGEILDFMTFKANTRLLFTEIFGPLIGLKEEWEEQGATPAAWQRWRRAGWTGTSSVAVLIAHAFRMLR